jgi:hypothetical protein
VFLPAQTISRHYILGPAPGSGPGDGEDNNGQGRQVRRPHLVISGRARSRSRPRPVPKRRQRLPCAHLCTRSRVAWEPARSSCRSMCRLLIRRAASLVTASRALLLIHHLLSHNKTDGTAIYHTPKDSIYDSSKKETRTQRRRTLPCRGSVGGPAGSGKTSCNC